MAGAGQDGAARTASGTQKVACWRAEHDPTAEDLELAQGGLIELPARVAKIVHQASGSTPAIYPPQGDGLLDAYNAGTPSATLDAAGIPDAGYDYTGFLLVMMAGAAVGEWRYGVAYNASTSVLTLNAAFDAAPSAGDAYKLLIPLFFRGDLLVFSNFSSSAGDQTAPVVTFRPIFFDFPRTLAASPALRAPFGYADTTLRSLTGFGNTASQVGVNESGYYHGQTLRSPHGGALGALLDFRAVTVGSVSLYAKI